MMLNKRLELLKNFFPAVSCTVKNKLEMAGYRLFFLVRSNGRDVLVYDTIGNPYCLSLQDLTIGEACRPFELSRDERKYTIATNIETGYTFTVGPLHQYAPNRKLGYIVSLTSDVRAGSGRKSATDLIEEERC